MNRKRLLAGTEKAFAYTGAASTLLRNVGSRQAKA
jgi:hypothetical protein